MTPGATVADLELLQVQQDTAWRGVLVSRPEKPDAWPVHRGTAVAIGPREVLLWTQAKRPASARAATYFKEQKSIPRPLVVRRHAGHGPPPLPAAKSWVEQMNWNNDGLYDALPTTLHIRQPPRQCDQAHARPRLPARLPLPAIHVAGSPRREHGDDEARWRVAASDLPNDRNEFACAEVGRCHHSRGGRSCGVGDTHIRLASLPERACLLIHRTGHRIDQGFRRATTCPNLGRHRRDCSGNTRDPRYQLRRTVFPRGAVHPRKDTR